MKCPACKGDVPTRVVTCPACGKTIPRLPVRGMPGTPPKGQASSSALPRLILLVVFGVGGASALVGGYWWFKIRPRVLALEGRPVGSAPSRAKTIDAERDTHRGFDLVVKLPGGPQGLATDGRILVAGHRKDPWGALRIEPKGDDEFRVQVVPILEDRYDQKIDVSSLTWNGQNFVGYTMAAWFGGQDKSWVYTIHDRESLKVIDHRPALPGLGAIAWDGQSYWAATRRNTQDADEPAFLYRLDRDFKVTGKFDPPAVGCQGLAWDGRFLWFADVFRDAIFVLDVSGEKPRVVHNESTSLDYLSGIAWFDGAIWVAEYGDNALHRVAAPSRQAWTKSAPSPPAALASMMPAATTPPAYAEGDNAELRRKLRSEESSERMRAQWELDRRNAPIDYDRDKNSFVDREPDDGEIIDWWVELKNDAVYGSWTVFIGPELMSRGQQSSTVVTIPTFTRYTVTVKRPGNLPPVEKVFEATAGDNIMRDVRLADAPSPGKYEVSLFIHAQYVTPDGEARILNRSHVSLELRK